MVFVAPSLMLLKSNFIILSPLSVLGTILELTRYVRPICFPPINTKRSFGVVIGWGRDSYHGEHSKELSDASVQIYPHTYCQEKLPSYLGFSKDLICGTDPNGSGTGTCRGDSGGPLFIFNPVTQRHEVLGTVQGSEECGKFNIPDVYVNTNEESIRFWITSVLKIAG